MKAVLFVTSQTIL